MKREPQADALAVLLFCARQYAAADAHLIAPVITEQDIIERNRAERLLKEAAVAYAEELKAAK